LTKEGKVVTQKPIPGPTWAVAPADWGATIKYDIWADPWTTKDQAIIHYGGGANTAGSVSGVDVEQLSDERTILRGWERYHLSKGWRGIAYNWAVGQSGTLYRLRGWNVSGAQYSGEDDIDHDGVDANSEGAAVVFILGGTQQPTPAAYAAFERLRAFIEQTVGAPIALYGHSEVALSGGNSTACPGVALMAYVRAHRTSGGTGGGVVPAPVAKTVVWPALLRPGNTHDCVPVLRGILYGLGYGGLAELPSPTYGGDLTAAVKAFQKAKGLTVDGIVGPASRAALGAAISKAIG
jgi:hypothetical protein